MFSWQSGIICTRPDLRDVLKGMFRFHGNRLRAALSAKRGFLSWDFYLISSTCQSPRTGYHFTILGKFFGLLFELGDGGSL